MSTKKAIRFEYLVDVLSYKNLESLSDEERKEFLQENEQFCSKTEKEPIFDYDAYMRRLESKIAHYGLAEHVVIKDCKLPLRVCKLPLRVHRP